MGVEDRMKHALGLLSTGAMLLATLPTAMAQSNYPAQPVRAIVTNRNLRP